MAGSNGVRDTKDPDTQGNREEQPRLELRRQGEDSFQTTRLDALLGWARKYSMAVYPFASACCGAELISSMGPRYDAERFGYSMPRFSPRQSDLLMAVGSISQRQLPVLKQVYDQMAEPKWVVAFGACACSGGAYDNYATLQGIDRIVPVDIYIPGCPPRPEAVLDGLIKLQELVQDEKVPRDGRHREPHELNLSRR